MNGKIADVHLVYGWKAASESFKGLLTEMTPEAMEKGLTSVFVEGNQCAFVGRVLASFKPSEGEKHAGALAPTPNEIEDLRAAMRMVGLEWMAAAEPPRLWTVMG